MTRLAAKGYKKYCDLQDEEFIAHQVALAGWGVNVRPMVDLYKRGQEYRYPPWGGKMQEDYGSIYYSLFEEVLVPE